VAVFLCNIIKEQTELLVARNFESAGAFLSKAEIASTIRALRMMSRLPDVIKEAEKQVEQVKEQRAKIAKATEQV